MRPTLSPSARVNELPPLEVRLAALLNSPGKGAGGADAVGTGGSALREACCPAARGCGGTSNGWGGSDSTGAGGDLAGGTDLATTGGAILGVTGVGSASALRTGVSVLGRTAGWSASTAGLPDGAFGLEISALMTGGGFTAGRDRKSTRLN